MASPEAAAPDKRLSYWNILIRLAPPTLVLALLVGGLVYAIYSRVQFSQEAEADTLREWLAEARVHRKTLPELVRDYLDLQARHPDPEPALGEVIRLRAEEIEAHLAALGNPTKIHTEQLPLFPVIYQIRLVLPSNTGGEPEIIEWDSGLSRPRRLGEVGNLEYRILGSQDPRAVVQLSYQLHAYNKRQEEEMTRQRMLRWLIVLASGAVLLAIAWAALLLKREREREVRELLAQQQVEHARRLVLESQLRQQEAEQRILEAETQRFHDISFMAASYAHNIKNMLVRPNDLLRRCLDTDGLRMDQRHLVEEVGQSLGTVTERLDLILKTVQRDPSSFEPQPLDLNHVARDLHRTWEEMAASKWKLALCTDLSAEPLPIVGDRSQLLQAAENLLFNARDATFDMRSQLREQVRADSELSEEDRRRKLIESAGWRGAVSIRTYRRDSAAILEVADNGIGMTEEVRQRCLEFRFSTKSDNALHHGNSAGAGIGLSFVQRIVESHRARLAIDSAPLKGTVFRLEFPIRAEN